MGKINIYALTKALALKPRGFVAESISLLIVGITPVNITAKNISCEKQIMCLKSMTTRQIN